MVRIIIEIDSGEAVVRGGEGPERTGAAAPTVTATAPPPSAAAPGAAYVAATNAGRAPLGPSAAGALSGSEGPLPFTEMAIAPQGTGEESAGAAPGWLTGPAPEER